MVRILAVFLLFTSLLFSEEWMDDIIAQEFHHLKKFSKEQLEATWKKSQKYSKEFQRFKVIKSKVYGPSGNMKNLLLAITQKYRLLDVDFIYYKQDSVSSTYFKKDEYAPIFVSAKSGGSNQVLFADWYYDFFASDGWNGLIGDIQANYPQLPWECRRNQLIWRGGANDGGYTPDNWQQRPRGKVVYFSRMNPHLADAAFTSFLPWNVSDPSYFMNQVGLASFLVPTLQMNYKYQIDIDGVTATFSALSWKLLSGSLVFKQTSPSLMWFYRALVPWEHYIPLKNDLSDLDQMIQWAITHDLEARKIAENGRLFALTHLMPEHILLYCYKALTKYASLQKFKPTIP